MDTAGLWGSGEPRWPDEMSEPGQLEGLSVNADM